MAPRLFEETKQQFLSFTQEISVIILKTNTKPLESKTHKELNGGK